MLVTSLVCYEEKKAVPQQPNDQSKHLLYSWLKENARKNNVPEGRTNSSQPSRYPYISAMIPYLCS